MADRAHVNGANSIPGIRVAVLLAEGVEDLEYWVTVMRLREAGVTVISVGSTTDEVTGKPRTGARSAVSPD
jgi:protease I